MPPKRNNKRKQGYNKRKPKVQKPLSVGVPRTQMVKLRYTDMFSLDGGIDEAAYRSYNLNGM